MSSEQSVKMLLVDDKSLTTNLDRAGYRKMGVSVKSAASYKEARDLIVAKQADIMVVNLDYPQIDGFAIASHTKKEFPDLGIVLTSVQGSASVRNRALATGADLFVEQPIPRHYFIEKIKGLLEQQTRSTERISVHGGVSFSFENQRLMCPIGDLSSSGMLIVCDLNIPDGTQLECQFQLPSSKKPLQVSGEVVRKIKIPDAPLGQDTGIGLRFENFMGDAEKRLQEYIERSSNQRMNMIYYL